MRQGETVVSGTSGGDLGWPLRRAAALYGSSTAIVDDTRSVSYTEMAGRVAALGAALEELAIDPGGRVGFLGVNSLAHIECVLGVPTAGRVLVDLNFRLSQAELEFIVADCGVEVLIVDDAQLAVARKIRDSCATVRQLVLDGIGEHPEDCVLYEDLLARRSVGPSAIHDVTDFGTDENALATISYTGGTTGAPKGVMLSHGNLLANARHNLMTTGHTSEDRWLHVCPMFHVAGTANIIACTWVGAKQVVLPRFDAAEVADAAPREAITHTLLVPTMLDMLLDELDRRPGERLPSLRHIQYAAAPISPALQRRVLERFDCDVVQMYGMTEAAPSVACLPAVDHRRGSAGEQPYAARLTSVGVPLIGVEAQVRDADGVPLPVGAVGEMCVRGSNVMLGYWNRPDATEAALAGGWYRTGDAARMDSDGYFYLVDRLKDMIITGGENVYSVEVEAALLEHAAVKEAAVFGTPHSRWGEAVHAVVVLKEEATVTSEQLITHCRSLIAGYKVPRSIDLRTQPLPKSGTGKVFKNRLREPFWVGHDRRVN
jgi:long-chain acyl-CoA synthetase